MGIFLFANEDAEDGDGRWQEGSGGGRGRDWRNLPAPSFPRGSPRPQARGRGLAGVWPALRPYWLPSGAPGIKPGAWLPGDNSEDCLPVHLPSICPETVHPSVHLDHLQPVPRSLGPARHPAPRPAPSLLPAMTSREPLHAKTPVRDSMALSKVAGTSVYLKMDSAQPSGSFKIRGIGHLCQTVQESSGRGWHGLFP